MTRSMQGFAIIGCFWTILAHAQVSADVDVAMQAGSVDASPNAVPHGGHCAPLNMIDNRSTPPDLYEAVGACVNTDHYDVAVRLFIIAGALWRFDAMRVADRTAYLAGGQLIVNTFGSLTPERRLAFKRSFDHMAESKEESTSICRRLEQMGPPSYFPRYMVLSGVHAYASDPYKDALLPTFDADEAWSKVLHEQVGCAN